VRPPCYSIHCLHALTPTHLARRGALYRLVQRNDLASVVLTCDKRAVSAGTLTAGEFAQLMAVLPSQTRRVNLIPVRSAVTIAKSLGDGPRVRALITALGTDLPRAWQMRDEQQALAAENEIDLVLEVCVAHLRMHACAD
jgi:hypothetical protein